MAVFFLVSDGPHVQTQHADGESTSKGKQEDESLNGHDEMNEQVELTLVERLIGWRDKHGDKSHRKTLRVALKSIGIEGNCFIGKDRGMMEHSK